MKRRLCSRLAVALAVIVYVALGADTTWATDAVTPNDRVQEFVTIRATPSAAANALGRLNVGDQAELLDSPPRWFRVRLADGTEGFVLKSYTTLVAATAQPLAVAQPQASTGLTGVPSVAQGSREMNAHFINVGQGAATLLEFPCGAILIDTGGEKNGFDGSDKLITYLTAFFARRTDLHGLDALLITHPHIDHNNGACKVIQQFQPKGLIDDGLAAVSPAIPGDTCIRNAAASGIPHQIVRIADVNDPKGITSDVINPLHCSPVTPQIRVLFGGVPQGAARLPGWNAKDSKNPNNNSVATRIDFGGFSMLITGDLEERGIKELLTRIDPATLDVDVYEAGHHGSRNGTTEPLVAAMSPAVAVIEVGEKSRAGIYSAFNFGHPNKQALDLLLDPQHGVARTRPAVTEPVGISGRNPTTHAPPVWSRETIDRAIYATAWDGTVVIHTDDQGKFDVFTEH